MIDAQNIQNLREQLEDELAQLLGHKETRQGKRGQQADKNLDRDDLARNFALREQRLALRDVEKVQLTRIEKALQRISDGTYGICAGCGEAIAPERLEIIPYATLCIRCQQEKREN